jgi:hypothetical protein
VAPSLELSSNAPSTLIFNHPSCGAIHLACSLPCCRDFPASREIDSGGLPCGSAFPPCCRMAHSSVQYFRKKLTDPANDNFSLLCVILFRTC